MAFGLPNKRQGFLQLSFNHIRDMLTGLNLEQMSDLAVNSSFIFCDFSVYTSKPLKQNAFSDHESFY